MPKRSRFPTGWIPDVPDRRDKSFRRAVHHQKSLKSASLLPEQGSTARGWLKSTRGLRNAIRLSTLRGSTGADDALSRALAEAFPAKYKPAKGPAARPRRDLLLDAPPGPDPDELPSRVDLRPFMSPIENQGSIGSCTAQAVVGLLEYLQIANSGVYTHASRSFLYKATRNLLQWSGDTGAYIRETIKTVRLFGTCPEAYWPYDEETFDDEPESFCYAFAGNYQALSYYRLDDLSDIWCSLAQGYPVALGFTCFESIDSDECFDTGFIPYPQWNENTNGAHAVLAVGYFDHGSNIGDEPADEGCLIIRNSWGEEWGDSGYGYLPYRYIHGCEYEDEEEADNSPPLSEDYWTITQIEDADAGDRSGNRTASGRGGNIAPFLLD